MNFLKYKLLFLFLKINTLQEFHTSGLNWILLQELERYSRLEVKAISKDNIESKKDLAILKMLVPPTKSSFF